MLNLANAIHCILGVTEAGDGEDGRVKSAAGIGTLLEDGIGDTIRVSLTEDPELEIPVCRDLVKRYHANSVNKDGEIPAIVHLPYTPFAYKRRQTFVVDNIGGTHVPVVIADLNKLAHITPESLQSVGYTTILQPINGISATLPPTIFSAAMLGGL